MAFLIDKIGKLKKNFEDQGAETSSLEDINNWEKNAKRALAYQTLAKNEIIREILKDYQQKITAINESLANDENLKDSERSLLFKEKTWRQEFINLFTSADSELEAIEKEVDENLV
ncbi:MAG: hypothetical protein WC619_01915 [Patescibacteria group bacterium]